jgi:hypothetical protein
MDSAARPPASAIRTAARTTRSRSSPSVVREGSRRAATTAPTRAADSMAPDCLSAARALVAVAMATPHSRTMDLVVGTGSPGRNSPVAMRCSISAAMRR